MFEYDDFINDMLKFQIESSIHSNITFQIAEMTGSYCLTNIASEDAKFILQAAKETGYNIYIEREAYPQYSLNRLPEYVAVYTEDWKRDHHEFWNRFNLIKQIKESESQ